MNGQRDVGGCYTVYGQDLTFFLINCIFLCQLRKHIPRVWKHFQSTLPSIEIHVSMLFFRCSWQSTILALPVQFDVLIFGERLYFCDYKACIKNILWNGKLSFIYFIHMGFAFLKVCSKHLQMKNNTFSLSFFSLICCTKWNLSVTSKL